MNKFTLVYEDAENPNISHEMYMDYSLNPPEIVFMCDKEEIASYTIKELKEIIKAFE